MDSAFSDRLELLIDLYREIDLELITELIVSESVDASAASEALRWIGRIGKKRFGAAITHLLVRCLFCQDPQIRDGAILGLGSIDDPSTIPHLQEAITRETIQSLRQDMQQVLDQLIQTQLEQSA
jgi:hypothetical protein